MTHYHSSMDVQKFPVPQLHLWQGKVIMGGILTSRYVEIGQLQAVHGFYARSSRNGFPAWDMT